MKRKTWTDRANYSRTDQQLLSELKEYVEINGIPARYKDICPINHLASYIVYHRRFGGSLSEWLQLCGINLTDKQKFNLSIHSGDKKTKADCIKIILAMQKEKIAPLMYDDFRGSSYDHVSITQIKKYWGSLNNMKKELGLEIIQNVMTKEIYIKDDFDKKCKDFATYIKENNIQSLTTRSMRKTDKYPSVSSLNRYSKKYYNKSIVDYLKSTYNIEFGKQGNGKVTKFDDGEVAVSNYEYNFSTFLRKIGLQFNKDYFRDIKYSTIDTEYCGQMNCDYMICINGRIIYVELAGLLNGKRYTNAYLQQIPITNSKSKELYRQKLNEKRRMLERNKCDYYIFCGKDLNQKLYENIFTNISSEQKLVICMKYFKEVI